MSNEGYYEDRDRNQGSGRGRGRDNRDDEEDYPRRGRGRGRDDDDRDDDDPYDDRRDDDYRPLEPIPNYLVQSILVTLCCCLPGGVVALVNAAQVDGKVKQGRYEEARRLSDTAKTWCIISAIIGVIVNILGIAVQIAAEMDK